MAYVQTSMVKASVIIRRAILLICLTGLSAPHLHAEMLLGATSYGYIPGNYSQQSIGPWSVSAPFQYTVNSTNPILSPLAFASQTISVSGSGNSIALDVSHSESTFQLYEAYAENNGSLDITPSTNMNYSIIGVWPQLSFTSGAYVTVDESLYDLTTSTSLWNSSTLYYYTGGTPPYSTGSPIGVLQANDTYVLSWDYRISEDNPRIAGSTFDSVQGSLHFTAQNVNAVPLPSSLTLLLSGLPCVCGYYFWRRRNYGTSST